MLTAQAEVFRNAKSTQRRAPHKAVNEASPLNRFVVGFDLSQPPAHSADFELLFANGEGVWARSLARTGRLHSAAVRDIVLL